MNKDKILSLSRKEHKHYDERKVFIERQSYANGFIAILALISFFYFGKLLFMEQFPEYAKYLFGPNFLGLGVYFTTTYYYTRKKRHLCFALLFGSVAMMFVIELFTGIGPSDYLWMKN